MHVYQITNTVNGKIYIGQHTGDDLEKYLYGNTRDAAKGLGSKPALFAAIRKYGPQAFTIESLVRLPDFTDDYLARQQLNGLEKFFIRTEDSRNRKIGYNIAEGGEGVSSLSWTAEMREQARQRVLDKPIDKSGFVMTDEIRARISAACMGKKMPPMTWSDKVWASRRANGTDRPGHSSKKGTKLSQATKDKISASKKGQVSPNKGKKMSEETKRRISEAKKGTPAWNRGKSWPDSMKEQLRAAGIKGAEARWGIKISG